MPWGSNALASILFIFKKVDQKKGDPTRSSYNSRAEQKQRITSSGPNKGNPGKSPYRPSVCGEKSFHLPYAFSGYGEEDITGGKTLQKENP